MDNQLEIWKDIPNYEGMYQVSSFGRVKSFKNGKENILKISTRKSYYRNINLSTNGRYITIPLHQLVAMAFLDHKPNGYEKVVDHIDNDKTNNHVSNLQVISARENASKNRFGKSKYTGVIRCENLWRCQIVYDKIRYHLGYFKDEELAKKRYEEALFNVNTMPEKDLLLYFKSLIKSNKSQYSGVRYREKRGRWECYAKVSNKYKFIGSFKTEIEAYEAREQFIKNLI